MKAMADTAATSAGEAVGRLSNLYAFGSDPGDLGARCYLPSDLPSGAALVVVLHGCTQTAAGYDHGSGWSALADRYGFALLFPEQKRSNNANRCFNWFEAGDTRRGSGEALSIRQMVEAMVDRHGLDPTRVFVTGLSAGGAMASVMLATYPEVFAGGAIIAGLPYGSAAGVPQALDRMRGHGGPDATKLVALVRQASDHDGPWPTVSVWHGTGDATVNPVNADAIIAQWRTLHGVGVAPDVIDTVDGYPHRVWRDKGGRAAIEDYRITGLGHGTPLATQGDEGCGTSGAFMLEANISSTRRIAESWGLVEERAQDRSCRASTPNSPKNAPTRSEDEIGTQVGKVIEDALRSAGLMR